MCLYMCAYQQIVCLYDGSHFKKLHFLFSNACGICCCFYLLSSCVFIYQYIYNTINISPYWNGPSCSVFIFVVGLLLKLLSIFVTRTHIYKSTNFKRIMIFFCWNCFAYDLWMDGGKLSGIISSCFCSTNKFHSNWNCLWIKFVNSL